MVKANWLVFAAMVTAGSGLAIGTLAADKRTAPQMKNGAVPLPAVPLPIEGELPSLAGATGWLNSLNSQPLAAADLRGKVVLVDFWTFTCINWRRSLPHVRAW